jgi:hypothetical protein
MRDDITDMRQRKTFSLRITSSINKCPDLDLWLNLVEKNPSCCNQHSLRIACHYQRESA